MAITPVFDVATRALHAQELVIRTTGHNLANVNRPGYSRQRVELTSERPTNFTPLVIGNGVRVETVRQIVDPIIERQLAHFEAADPDYGRRVRETLKAYDRGELRDLHESVQPHA